MIQNLFFFQVFFFVNLENIMSLFYIAFLSSFGQKVISFFLFFFFSESFLIGNSAIKTERQNAEAIVMITYLLLSIKNLFQ